MKFKVPKGFNREFYDLDYRGELPNMAFYLLHRDIDEWATRHGGLVTRPMYDWLIYYDPNQARYEEGRWDLEGDVEPSAEAKARILRDEEEFQELMRVQLEQARRDELDAESVF